MPKTTVVIADLSQETLASAFDATFAPFGGVQAARHTAIFPRRNRP